MAKKLNIITSGGEDNLPVANQGLKLSKSILLEKIEEHPKFRELYSIDDDLLQRIADDMKRNKFDASQPVHIWTVTGDDGTEHSYLIDGYTRLKAARLAGLLTVPYFEHRFGSFEEAHRYALHLQVDRRNLEGADFLRNIEALMGSDYIRHFEGNKNAAIGRLLGKSEKTIERANFVERNATDEQKERIESGEATINATYNDIKQRQYVEKHASDDQKERVASGTATVGEMYDELKSGRQQEKEPDRHVTDGSEPDPQDSDLDAFDDISESLSDTSGDPKGIVIGDHSDHIERPTNKLSAEEDSERTRERRTAYLTGLLDGFTNGFCHVLAKVLEKNIDLPALYADWFLRKELTGESLEGLSFEEDKEFCKAWFFDNASDKASFSDYVEQTLDFSERKSTDESGSGGGITPDIEIEGD